jgi:hypothetical protein
MLAMHHAKREMVTMLVYPRIYAQRVAELQKPTEKGIYEALKEGFDLVLMAVSPRLRVCRLVLIRNLMDLQGESLLSV